MPVRKTLLRSGYIYHIFNRGVDRAPIYKTSADYERFVELIRYYKLKKIDIGFSHFRDLSLAVQNNLLLKYKSDERIISLIGWTLMPNHFHLILRQEADEGIKTFMSKILIGYSKFFNMKHKRVGPLFQGRYQTVLIETEEQLLHVVRYVHLNVYSSGVVSSFDRLLEYPWSSLREYLGLEPRWDLCDNKELVTDHFSGGDSFKAFTLNQADYQKGLERIKHLVFE